MNNVSQTDGNQNSENLKRTTPVRQTGIRTAVFIFFDISSGRESDRRESGRRELEQREASGKRRGRFATVIIAGVAVLAVAGLGYAGIQKKKAAEAASAKATAEAEDSNTVTWQGKNYKYNQNLSNYLSTTYYLSRQAYTGRDKSRKSRCRTGRCLIPAVAEP